MRRMNSDNPSDTAIGEYNRNEVVVGSVAPAERIADAARVVQEMLEAFPKLRYTRDRVKVSGTSGRLLSPKKKQVILDWLFGTA